MSGFIQGTSRSQATLFPDRIDDYITEDNSIRVIDAFVDSLDLFRLGFKTEPAQTGRPGYHPDTMLKLFIYGYLNRLQSSRRLEQEAHRNLELMWLLERLSPDFKTIADFRKDNGKSIQQVCRKFVLICRKLDLLSNLIAIDGSKFKAVNNRDKSYTENTIKTDLKKLDDSIQKYLLEMGRLDAHHTDSKSQISKERLAVKIQKLKNSTEHLKCLDQQIKASPHKQISKTDPDSRAMKAKDKGFVGYNVQSAVDTKSHIIVTHEVTNIGVDRNALANIAKKAKQTIKCPALSVVADRGYYTGTELLACSIDKIDTYVPKPMTSNNRSKGLFDKADFTWIPETQEYQCPAGERFGRRTTMKDRGKVYHRYWSKNCQQCAMKSMCTTGKERRISRWEHEEIYEQTDERLFENPEMMAIRQSTVEHPFGTIKDWMGYTHFKMKTLKHVSTEMSLHVLAYNMKRAIKILGSKPLISALAG